MCLECTYINDEGLVLFIEIFIAYIVYHLSVYLVFLCILIYLITMKGVTTPLEMRPLIS